MKALRELLIRTDSMDTRLGNYGENLRKINRTLYGTHQQHHKTNNSTQQTTFMQSIDELNLDDTADDPVNRSRSCDDTSFFEVLDEVNTSIAQLPDKFIVGPNKRVQIVANSTSDNRSAPRINVSTPATTEKLTNASSSKPPSNHPHTESRTNSVGGQNVPRDDSARPNAIPLKVASFPTDEECFYVTPFTPDQSEEEVKKYVIEISNADASLVKVTKLVPRGRSIDDLSFVSFKVTTSKNVSSVVGDPWYWPQGVTVRAFEPNQKNGAIARLPLPQ